MAVIVRLARTNEAAQIAAVCAAGWRDTYAGLLPPAAIDEAIATYYTPTRIEGEVGGGASDGWLGYAVAVSDGEVLGAAGGGLTGPGVGELFVLYVRPDVQARGLGSRLLDFVTGQQVGRGAREQWVSVYQGNPKGEPFYRARGFEFVEAVTPWDGLGAEQGVKSLRLRRTVAP
ncbi:GNAT family N-acetyltransferase [Paractinoplanes lichenicola]|uniref:GNAT family N-acetyltransferase n=1 Tax=Paractinoplanes lichenicola TaxID=2802976 RepID=A0ABS1W2T7_9ACTN|nr:GNAT family N-acetyltransferase [Actinoplanes lichenicola]MBL7261046.1 GNAT family N-acetyltransferase [Actinoplanes lichenicola]